MRHNLLVAAIALFTLALCATAGYAADKKFDDLMGFLNAHYSLIGKKPGSSETYSGTISIEKHGGRLEVIRCIGKHRTVGSGSIVPITSDRIPNLKVHWREGKDDYEALYMIHADADNYGRLSGPYVRTHDRTEKFGWELLYVDPGDAKVCK